MDKTILWMGRLSVLALLVGSAGGASAQTLGTTVASFNILSNNAITLTGFAAAPFNVPVAGTSPGVTRTMTDASMTTFHPNDATSINGQAEAVILNNSLTAPAGATFLPLGGTLPVALNVSAGITVYQAAGPVTNLNSALTITGSPTSVVIFQIPTALSITNTDIILAGGILPNNVYWKVHNGATIKNNDAANRTYPGTIVNDNPADNIAITCSGAGSLGIGRLLSIGGDVTVTQSGAGTLTISYPGNVGPVLSSCNDGFFYPSPATGATGTFVYCMQSAGTVRIKVYNVIGDLAAKIEDDKLAGTQLSTVNTARLAPGVYLYLLERDYGNGNKSSSKVKKFVVKR